MRPFNFSPGPAVLPDPVLEHAAAEMLDWHGTGMGVMEMSHRGKEFLSIYEEAERDLRRLLGVPANYKILFVQGGATLQCGQIPNRVWRRTAKAHYVGRAAQPQRATQEAKQY